MKSKTKIGIGITAAVLVIVAVTLGSKSGLFTGRLGGPGQRPWDTKAKADLNGLFSIDGTSFTVKNSSQKDVRLPFLTFVDYYGPNQFNANTTYPSRSVLNAGGTITFKLSKDAVCKSNEIKVEIDWNNEINEADENNNKYIFSGTPLCSGATVDVIQSKDAASPRMPVAANSSLVAVAKVKLSALKDVEILGTQIAIDPTVWNSIPLSQIKAIHLRNSNGVIVFSDSNVQQNTYFSGVITGISIFSRPYRLKAGTSEVLSLEIEHTSSAGIPKASYSRVFFGSWLYRLANTNTFAYAEPGYIDIQ